MTTLPLITLPEAKSLFRARNRREQQAEISLDLQKTRVLVRLHPDHWEHVGQQFPYPERCKARTVYYWTGHAFEVAARFSASLVKLVPTEWGPPTFEIDGIKMLPSARVSPYEDAQRKVALIAPRGKRILDTCGGLGYFAAWCLQGGARWITSFEKNPDVLWLRNLNPWSPGAADTLALTNSDVAQHVLELESGSYDAILHDPPRFGVAGELYSQSFYGHLARLLVRGGQLFHYTGTPNKLTSNRDVPTEIAGRLRAAGFRTRFALDGVWAEKLRPRSP